jgi:hypothetical protein
MHRGKNKMKSSELIEYLKYVDPEGNKQVVDNLGSPIVLINASGSKIILTSNSDTIMDLFPWMEEGKDK